MELRRLELRRLEQRGLEFRCLEQRDLGTLNHCSTKNKNDRRPPVIFVYRPRKKEISKPKNPITPKPTITNPNGTLPAAPGNVSGGNVGIASGPGGVNVGKRVGGISTINWAARVGSTVGVVRGVGVGGGSTTGTLPTKVTSGE